MENFLDWLAPIMSTLITTGGLALINAKINLGERKRDEARAETEEKRASEKKWRDAIEKRMNEQDEKIDAVLQGQTTQMRSDLVHRAHRYLDDLGKASTDEKNAFDSEYHDYCDICDAFGIENSFIDELHKRVMSLPEREL